MEGLSLKGSVDFLDTLFLSQPVKDIPIFAALLAAELSLKLLFAYLQSTIL